MPFHDVLIFIFLSKLQKEEEEAKAHTKEKKLIFYLRLNNFLY